MEYYLICKKDFFINYTFSRSVCVQFFGNRNINKISCIKNKKYKVEPNQPEDCFKISNHNTVTGEKDQKIILTNKDLKEYFYSKKEERNIKLKIINKIK